MIVPVDASVNVTVNGNNPLVGAASNAATGTNAPVAVTVPVALPPLALANTTVPVNAPAALGAHCTTTLAEPPPDTAKVLPETTVNGVPITVAVPLLTAVWPVLLTVNVCDFVAPTDTTPRSALVGLTAMLPGVRPVPLTLLVDAPPLLLKITVPVTLPETAGANAMLTVPVAPAGTV